MEPQGLFRHLFSLQTCDFTHSTIHVVRVLVYHTKPNAVKYIGLLFY